jgi:ATP-dependent helicase Lhr and Lhr-like helicase
MLPAPCPRSCNAWGARADVTTHPQLPVPGDQRRRTAAGSGLIELWQRGYVEPVQAPPCPYHILAQQLMALILQERGIGKSQWFSWIERVPGFAEMPPERVAELVEFMVAKGILWSDDGILAFAPEGESTFGRRNFMDILSVFTSPPLFKVMSGQKELGNVHESTFYKRDEGPPILVLAGRSWKTSTWTGSGGSPMWNQPTRRVRSRWLGRARCSATPSARAFAGSSPPMKDPTWSKRAVQQLTELRDEHPWVSPDATSLVQQPNGQIRWWTFAGGIANTLLADT